MRIESVKVSDIKVADYNPRKDLKPGDAEYDAIERSIKRWDLVEPLVWNVKTGDLVSGHQRLKVLVAHGAVSVDVSVVDLELKEEQALNVALNKVQGAWDNGKVADLIADLDSGAFDDLTATGFSVAELSDLMKAAAPAMYEQPAPSVSADGNSLTDGAVTAREVRSVAEAQASKFAGVQPSKQIKPVTCPSCGHTFGVVM